MANIDIHIENLNEFIAAMQKSPAIVTRKLQRAIDRASLRFLGATKEIIRSGRDMWKPPIDTGYMWNTIFRTSYNLRAEIIPTASYSVYVHEGTAKMRARPYLEITEHYEETEMAKIFTEELDDAMAEIAGGI